MTGDRNPEALACERLRDAAISLAVSSRHSPHEDIIESKREQLLTAMANVVEEMGLGGLAGELHQARESFRVLDAEVSHG